MDIRSHRWVVVAYAFLAPLVVAAALGAVRESVTATTAALVLVVVVVSAAASGVRSAGIVAALSAGAWFDYFLTQPYGSFKVTDTDDLQATVLLLVVGVVVSEIALWGRRQQARASRRSGYLEGVLGTADVVAHRNGSPETLADRVAHQIVEILGIDACRFDTGTARAITTLDRDGTVRQRGEVVDVDRHGLPTDDVISLDVGGFGHFLLTSSTRTVRPTLQQRRVVGLLADQVALALTTETT